MKQRKQKKQKKKLTIDNLNDDVLIIIFKKYLSISQKLLVERVCGRWSIIAQQCWSDITTMKIDNNKKYEFGKYFDTEGTNSIFHILLIRCGHYLNTLTIHPICNSDVLTTIRFNCYNLLNIDLEFKNNSIEYFVKPFEKMKKLEKCKIKNITSLLAKDCLISLTKNIQVIHMEVPKSIITYSSRLLISSLSSVFMKFNLLTSLTMRGYRFSGKLINSISHIKTITFIDLEGCIIEKIDDLSNLINLKYLNVSKVDAINNYFLILVSKNCNNLKYLDIGFCKKVYDDGVKEIIKYCLNLEKLKIKYTSITSDIIISAINIKKYTRNGPILHIHPGPYNKFKHPQITCKTSYWYLKIIYDVC